MTMTRELLSIWILACLVMSSLEFEERSSEHEGSVLLFHSCTDSCGTTHCSTLNDTTAPETAGERFVRV